MVTEWRESELENAVKNNISLLNKAIGNTVNLKILGTQVNCIFGRIDMLAWWECNLLVIEFKAVTAGEKELGQVLRYCSTVKSSVNIYSKMKPYPDYEMVEPQWEVVPVIVAPDFDRKLGYVDCLLVEAYKNDDGEFELEKYWIDDDLDYEKENKPLKKAIHEFELHLVGASIGRTMEDGLKNLKERLVWMQ